MIPELNILHLIENQVLKVITRMIKMQFSGFYKPSRQFDIRD
jgi:hypothetical protein